MSPSCASLFLVLPLLALKSSEKKNATTVRTIGENQSPFCLHVIQGVGNYNGDVNENGKKAIGLD